VTRYERKRRRGITKNKEDESRVRCKCLSDDDLEEEDVEEEGRMYMKCTRDGWMEGCMEGCGECRDSPLRSAVAVCQRK